VSLLVTDGVIRRVLSRLRYNSLTPSRIYHMVAGGSGTAFTPLYMLFEITYKV
jgi:hypothetical protein